MMLIVCPEDATLVEVTIGVSLPTGRNNIGSAPVYVGCVHVNSLEKYSYNSVQ